MFFIEKLGAVVNSSHKGLPNDVHNQDIYIFVKLPASGRNPIAKAVATGRNLLQLLQICLVRLELLHP